MFISLSFVCKKWVDNVDNSRIYVYIWGTDVYNTVLNVNNIVENVDNYINNVNKLLSVVD
jgi:hypothetical protein